MKIKSFLQRKETQNNYDTYLQKTTWIKQKPKQLTIPSKMSRIQLPLPPQKC